MDVEEAGPGRPGVHREIAGSFSEWRRRTRGGVIPGSRERSGIWVIVWLEPRFVRPSKRKLQPSPIPLGAVPMRPEILIARHARVNFMRVDSVVSSRVTTASSLVIVSAVLVVSTSWLEEQDSFGRARALDRGSIPATPKLLPGVGGEVVAAAARNIAEL